jgi:tripartite-type tricarboxylate transporter receptor subunit TctC
LIRSIDLIDYSAKPIQLLVPYALGGSVNIVGGRVRIMVTGVSSSVSKEVRANDPEPLPQGRPH